MRFLLYLIAICDDINLVCSMFLYLILPTALVFYGISRAMGDEDFALIRTWLKRVIFWSIIMVGIGVAVPNTKEMAVIYIIPKLASNEQVSQLPENLLILVNDWAKKQIK